MQAAASLGRRSHFAMVCTRTKKGCRRGKEIAAPICPVDSRNQKARENVVVLARDVPHVARRHESQALESRRTQLE